MNMFLSAAARFPFILTVMVGALLPFSLAPYHLWPLGLLAVAALAGALVGKDGKRCLQLAFGFGLGMYGSGASWVYISIHTFGHTPALLAGALTAAFVACLAFVFALPFYVYGRWLNRTPLALLIAFPAIWVLGEWTRTWLLTGFPWLFLGYGHLRTPLAGWAPVLGVLGVSFVAASTATVALQLLLFRRDNLWTKRHLLLGLWPLAFWLGGFGLHQIQWTRFDDAPVSVGMAQPNIPQDRKWDPAYRGETFRIFNDLSRSLWGYDWVIWPEAAIPMLYHDATSTISALDAKAMQTNTVFITGILYDQAEPDQYFNSLIALGKGSGISYKTRLVPFGEYVPLESVLRGTLDFFDLPTSIIHAGPEYTDGLQAGVYTIAPTICYEVVYPDLVAHRAVNSHVLLTVSNDAWFGRSIGPVQHFQMAQMRALETGRYMIRSTNNGISGIIGPKGEVVVTGNRYTRESIRGVVRTAEGTTPFMWWQSWPVVALCLLAITWTVVLARRTHRTSL